MKRLLVMLMVLVAFSAGAHIGSVNVFFDGNAGDYPVHVLIRPPKVVPGLAEISVRVDGAGVGKVSVLPVYGDAGNKGAPPPDVATLVSGETNLYTAMLWLMRSGGYSVNVSVEGARGGGTVIVPVNAIATNTLGMSPALGWLLLALAFLLFVAAVRIAGAIFGESLVPPGETAKPARIWKGRIAMVIVAFVFLLALWGGRHWWNLSEKEYRSSTLYRAPVITASVEERTNQDVLNLKIDQTGEREQTPELIPDHGKLMHLFLIREPGLDVFAHLHPVKRSWEKFELALPPLPAGHYLVYADITHETGFAETLTTNVDVPAPSLKILQSWGGGSAEQICGMVRTAPPEGFPLPPDMDDSWHFDRKSGGAHSNNVAQVSDGRSIVWLTAGDLVADREVPLRFQLLDTNGQPAAIEPYIGMFGHAAVRRDDGSVFAHIHPTGTFSMAAQEYFSGVTNTVHAVAESSNAVREVSFPFAFPTAGAYHVWAQLKSGGKIYTGAFVAVVKGK